MRQVFAAPQATATRWRHLPNLLTAARVLLALPVALAIGYRDYRTALVLAALAALTDAFDGFLARRFAWQSRLGELLDPLADKLVARFAAAPAQAGGTVGRLWVGDLRSARQYAALMLLLRNDPRIRGVRPLQADGDSLLLSLQLDVPLTTVAADLAASGHMVNAGAQPGADVALDWVR